MKQILKCALSFLVVGGVYSQGYDISLVAKKRGEYCFSQNKVLESASPCVGLAEGGIAIRHFGVKSRFNIERTTTRGTRQALFGVMVAKKRFAVRFLTKSPETILIVKPPRVKKGEKVIWLLALADGAKLTKAEQLEGKLLELPLVRYRDFPELRFVSGGTDDRWVFSGWGGNISHTLTLNQDSSTKALAFNTSYHPNWLVFESLNQRRYDSLIRLLARLRST